MQELVFRDYSNLQSLYLLHQIMHSRNPQAYFSNLTWFSPTRNITSSLFMNFNSSGTTFYADDMPTSQSRVVEGIAPRKEAHLLVLLPTEHSQKVFEIVHIKLGRTVVRAYGQTEGSESFRLFGEDVKLWRFGMVE